jgi:LytS/YehU family sensor histidine kinase
LVFLLSGSVEKTDSRGKPTEFLGVLRNVTAERKSTELRIAAARRASELRNLRATLNPHFLFNSLNVLKSLIMEDAAKAQHAVVSLAALLRSSLRATRQNLIPLRDELSVIRSFLDLQKMRYEGRLQTLLSIESEAEGTMVPPMLFQQLVENAVKHGIDSRISGGEVRVEALLEKDHLLLTTTNPGTYTEGPHDGFGLQSVREQLDSIYGSAATFHIGKSSEGMVTAEIRIPLEET